MNPYIGHDSQLYGVEEHRLVGGKGDGMRLYEISNGRGLELTVSPDRAGGNMAGDQYELSVALRLCGPGVL